MLILVSAFYAYKNSNNLKQTKVEINKEVEQKEEKDESAAEVVEEASQSDEEKATEAASAVAPTVPVNPSETAAPVAPAKSPDVVVDKLFFNADFETGDLSQWYNVQACPDRIKVVNDPLGSNNKVGMYTVGDGDIKANCPKSPTSDPRAQTLSTPLLKEGGGVLYFG